MLHSSATLHRRQRGTTPQVKSIRLFNGLIGLCIGTDFINISSMPIYRIYRFCHRSIYRRLLLPATEYYIYMPLCMGYVVRHYKVKAVHKPCNALSKPSRLHRPLKTHSPMDARVTSLLGVCMLHTLMCSSNCFRCRWSLCCAIIWRYLT